MKDVHDALARLAEEKIVKLTEVLYSRAGARNKFEIVFRQIQSTKSRARVQKGRDERAALTQTCLHSPASVAARQAINLAEVGALT